MKEIIEEGEQLACVCVCRCACQRNKEENTHPLSLPLHIYITHPHGVRCLVHFHPLKQFQHCFKIVLSRVIVLCMCPLQIVLLLSSFFFLAFRVVYILFHLYELLLLLLLPACQPASPMQQARAVCTRTLDSTRAHELNSPLFVAQTRRNFTLERENIYSFFFSFFHELHFIVHPYV